MLITYNIYFVAPWWVPFVMNSNPSTKPIRQNIEQITMTTK